MGGGGGKWDLPVPLAGLILANSVGNSCRSTQVFKAW